MKLHLHCIGFVLGIIASSTCAFADVGQAPSGLLCNLLTQPDNCVITEPIPDFGWIVNSTIPEDYQTAYRILVASSRDVLLKEDGDCWDSGKVVSSQSINVLYEGKPLSSNTSYWWAVKTWNKAGDASPFSKPQRFNMGELNRPDKQWPGESRWVQLADKDGKLNWTFENRPPVNFHPNHCKRLIQNPDGTWFVDFGKAAFSTLEVSVDWTPVKKRKKEHTIIVAVGEKNNGTTVERNPGGGIIYQEIPLNIRPGKYVYHLEIPRHKAHYPHSQTMPDIIPEVIPFRYCELRGEGESISVEAPIQHRLWVDFDDKAASFTSSSPDLNAVYELCKYSVKVNTFNGDYAASQRERMMYEADSYIHQMSHYATDRNFTTGRYSAENQIFHASWPTEWISHSIFMVWADYLHSGNNRSLQRYYDELKPKTLLALKEDNGLISTRTGKATEEFRKTIHLNNKNFRDIVDWPAGERDNYDFRDYNTVVNAFHYRSLVLMAKIAEALNKKDDAVFYRQNAERVLKVVNSTMFDLEKGVYVDGIGTTHVTLHANLFPLAFGMVPEEHRKSVVDYINSRGMACSVYPTVYLLEGLYDAGEAQAALDLMTATHDRSWLHMLAVGSTVTTEAWDIKYKNNSGWTHAWSSAPAQILPRKLVGIEPLEPGFGRIKIHPRLASLTSASAKLPTIRGPIEAKVIKEPEKLFELTVTIPANVSARIEIPLPGGEGDVLMDGKKMQTEKIDGLAIIDPVGSGIWHFRTTTNVIKPILPPKVISLRASSTQSPNHPVNNLTDGNERTFWVSQTGPTADQPQSIEMHYSAPVTVSTMLLIPRQKYGPKSGKLEAWVDRKWVVIQDDMALPDETAAITFNEIIAEGFRLIIDDGYDRANGDIPRNVQICELKFK